VKGQSPGRWRAGKQTQRRHRVHTHGIIIGFFVFFVREARLHVVRVAGAVTLPTKPGDTGFLLV
jgi:hypothetical protein